jgi:hypothetical protein
MTSGMRRKPSADRSSLSEELMSVKQLRSAASLLHFVSNGLGPGRWAKFRCTACARAMVRTFARSCGLRHGVCDVRLERVRAAMPWPGRRETHAIAAAAIRDFADNERHRDFAGAVERPSERPGAPAKRQAPSSARAERLQRRP